MYYRTILLYKQTIKKGGPNLNNFITDMHEPCLQLVGFKESAVPKSFNPVGNFYELNDNCGKGFYWVYGNSNKYTITLQECTMFDEYELQYTPPKYMGINYYCSAAKIEKSPYKAISNMLPRQYRNYMLPLVTSQNPTINFIIVDLPEPEGPTIAVFPPTTGEKDI